MKYVLGLLLLAFSAVSVAQYEGIEIVEVDNGPDVPGKTYRIYAKLATDSSQVVGVYGNSTNPLKIETTTSFYQHEYGGGSSTNLNRKMVKDNTNLKYDSYVTIGYEDNYVNMMNSSTIDLETFEKGGSIEDSDGMWYAMPYSRQCYPNKDGMVLIMQLTTTGKVTATFNLMTRHLVGGKNAAGNNNFESIEHKGLTFTCG